tara:strand:- start:93 stop:596 length:504 start_codon:yes stop_codon:yes gene_type:complete
MFSQAEYIELRSLLIEWFRLKGRHNIPWKLTFNNTQLDKGEMIVPYGIWIAEIMLQQTQINVVIPYWLKWMSFFENLNLREKATKEDVLFLWQGLGYYSRAHRILEASKILFNCVEDDHVNNPQSWPQDIETWRSLPGIGRNTELQVFFLPHLIFQNLSWMTILNGF